MIGGGVLMGLGVILLIIKCVFFRKPIYYEDEDEDEMIAEKVAAAAIEKKSAKSSAEAKNGDSSMPNPHLAITITPASDGSQGGSRVPISPSKCIQKEIETCTKEEAEALTSSTSNGRNRKSPSPSKQGNDDFSDNRNNIKMQQIKTSASKNSSIVIATSAETSLSTIVKHDDVQSKNPSAV